MIDDRVWFVLPHLIQDPGLMLIVVLLLVIENIIIVLIVAKIVRVGMIKTEQERLSDRAKYYIRIRDAEIRRLKRDLVKNEEIIETLMTRLQGARAWALLINRRFDIATAQLVRVTEGVKGNIRKIKEIEK